MYPNDCPVQFLGYPITPNFHLRWTAPRLIKPAKSVYPYSRSISDPALPLEGWSKVTDDAIVVVLLLRLALRRGSSRSGDRPRPGSSRTSIATTTDDTVRFIHAALVLKLVDHASEEIAFLHELIVLGFEVIDIGLKGCLFCLICCFICLQVLDSCKQKSLLAICLIEHVAEPSVVDGLVWVGSIGVWKGSANQRKL